MVAALSDNALWEHALGRIGREFSVRRRSDRLEIVEQGLDLRPVATTTTIAADVPAVPAGKPGRPELHGRSRAPLSLHGRGDGQRDRLGRDRRGDGPRRDARGLRRGGPAAAGRSRRRSTGSSGRSGESRPVRLQPDPQPERAGPRGGGRRPLPAPRGPAGRGVGLPRPDAAGRPLPGRGASARDDSGRVVAPNRVIAKVSRVEVASKFLAPPPAKFLRELVAAGEITPEQAEWAARDPDGRGLTAEADSGGHTDNQPAIVLLPTMLALRDRLQAQYGYDRPLAGRRGGRDLDPLVGGGGVRDGGGLRRDRLGQPGVRRVGHVRRRPADARPGAAGRHRDGPGGRHVRDGRQGPGAQARHHVRHAGRQALRALPRLRRPRRDPRRRAGRRWRRPSSAPRSRRSGTRPGPTSGSATRRRSSGPSATPSTRWRWCSAGISASRRTGPTRASRRGRSTTRSGAARRWRRSTTGSAGRSWSSPRTAGWSTVALNILYGAAVLTRARILRASRASPARRACRGCRPWSSARLRTD